MHYNTVGLQAVQDTRSTGSTGQQAYMQYRTVGIQAVLDRRSTGRTGQ